MSSLVAWLGTIFFLRTARPQHSGYASNRWAEAKLALAPFQTRNRQPHQIKDQREENDPSGQAIKL